MIRNFIFHSLRCANSATAKIYLGFLVSNLSDHVQQNIHLVKRDMICSISFCSSWLQLFFFFHESIISGQTITCIKTSFKIQTAILTQVTETAAIFIWFNPRWMLYTPKLVFPLIKNNLSLLMLWIFSCFISYFFMFLHTLDIFIYPIILQRLSLMNSFLIPKEDFHEIQMQFIPAIEKMNEK